MLDWPRWLQRGISGILDGYTSMHLTIIFLTHCQFVSICFQWADARFRTVLSRKIIRSNIGHVKPLAVHYKYSQSFGLLSDKKTVHLEIWVWKYEIRKEIESRYVYITGKKVKQFCFILFVNSSDKTSKVHISSAFTSFFSLCCASLQAFYGYFILDDSLFCPVENQWDDSIHFKSFNSVIHRHVYKD